MDEGDIQQSIDAAFQRWYFAQAWLDNRLETDIFLDYLDENQIDVFDLPAAWQQQGIIV